MPFLPFLYSSLHGIFLSPLLYWTAPSLFVPCRFPHNYSPLLLKENSPGHALPHGYTSLRFRPSPCTARMDRIVQSIRKNNADIDISQPARAGQKKRTADIIGCKMPSRESTSPKLSCITSSTNTAYKNERFARSANPCRILAGVCPLEPRKIPLAANNI